MKYRYNKEIIKYTNGLPLKLYVCRIDSVPFHWHSEMEILFLVQGSLNVKIEKNNYQLQQDDLILLNGNEVHSFERTEQENLVIIVQIDLERFKSYYPAINKTYFLCNSIEWDKDNEKMIKLRHLLVDILKVFNKKEAGFMIELDIIVQNIILHLIREYEKITINEEKNEKSSENLKRLERILKYIDQHYSTKITLDDIAKSEYLSTYYFSHFFKDKIGMTFQAYLKHVRLKKAYLMLIQSDMKIVDIAHKCGFTNSQIFSSYFKEEFGVSPTQQRRNLVEGKIKMKDNQAIEHSKYFDEDINTVLNEKLNF